MDYFIKDPSHELNLCVSRGSKITLLEVGDVPSSRIAARSRLSSNRSKFSLISSSLRTIFPLPDGSVLVAFDFRGMTGFRVLSQREGSVLIASLDHYTVSPTVPLRDFPLSNFCLLRQASMPIHSPRLLFRSFHTVNSTEDALPRRSVV
ncbi:hypothetical protein Tco_0025717 [Tanacetum coccineum]